ncbi:MAG TPA: ABC transporter permease, partial [Candidatus Krumholzibacterium sp.]|nr:ABC transporter permease [Candidatus Krumholzibacterium sp.]
QRTSVLLSRQEGSNAEAGETASVAVFRGVVKTIGSLLEIEKGIITDGSPWLTVSEDTLQGSLQLVIDNVPAGRALIEARLDSLMAREQAVTVVPRMAGRAQSTPGGFQGSVPGNLVMFVLMTMAFSGIAITYERKTGVLMRIGASPAGRWDIVSGKLLGRMMLSTLQILLLLVAGKYLFGISLGDNVPALALLMLSFAFCAGGFSLLFGALFRDPDQMSGFAVIATLVMSALGGCWWPLEIVPGWARALAFFFPTGWTISGIHKLISFGYGFSSVAGHIAALMLFGLVFLAIASWRLRWDR